MKTRSSLVSNSSTSSSILIAPTKSHHVAMEQLSNRGKKFINEIVSFDEIFQIPIVMIHQVTDSGGCQCPPYHKIICDILQEDGKNCDDDDEYEDLFNELEKYEKILRTFGEYVVSEREINENTIGISK